MTKIVWALSILMTFGGVGVGLRAAYAEGDGCKTYLAFNPSPNYFCVKSECNTPGQDCILVSSPYPECACDGNYQYPFCVLGWTWDPVNGYQVTCTPLLCPNPAVCDPVWTGFVVRRACI